jgi:hypothetical protein
MLSPLPHPPDRVQQRPGLGVAAMPGCDAADPVTGEPVRVTFAARG